MKLTNKKLMPSYNRLPISFEKGKGVWVFGDGGVKSYIQFGDLQLPLNLKISSHES